MATQQELQPDLLLLSPLLSCERVSAAVMRQAMLRAMLSPKVRRRWLRLSCDCDVLLEKPLLPVIRLGRVIELLRRQQWQERL